MSLDLELPMLATLVLSLFCATPAVLPCAAATVATSASIKTTTAATTTATTATAVTAPAGATPPSAMQSPSPRILILGYHEVEPAGMPPHVTIPRESATGTATDEMQLYTISPEAFRQQLDALASHGYSVIAMADLLDYMSGRRATLPARSVVITADDGWRSVNPMSEELLKRGQPFTAFVYPRVIDRHSHHVFNVTWDEITSLAKRGIDIESHTYSHPFLSRGRHADLTPEQYAAWLSDELQKSRDGIREHTGREVRVLAYPYGDYDAGVIAAARAAGYAGAVTVSPGVVTHATDPFAMPRYLLRHDTTLAQFESWLEPKP
jgi:peptidoglycan/xylan/chitin deacetylase (PgdA/CDA1 family)